MSTSADDIHRRRVAMLRAGLKLRRLDAFVTSHAASLRYLCGYSGSNGLLIITPQRSVFLTDFRYKEAVASEVTADLTIIGAGSLLQVAADRKHLAGRKQIGFEKEHLTVAAMESVRRLIDPKRIVPVAGLVEQLRMVKDDTELALLRNAFTISDKVFTRVLGIIKPGITERELSAEISYLHKRYGAENDSFDVIVASGARGSLPHGTASDKPLRNREFITLDFGCLYNGYHSDMTRTVCLGSPTAEMRKVYRIVADAQQRGCDAVRAGIEARKVDGVSRRMIANAGYGKFFGHSLGHGVGLDIHELPRVAPKSADVLKEGNVITIEPGIYLPGRFGIRIEDTVIVRTAGCDLLTGSPKELIVL